VLEGRHQESDDPVEQDRVVVGAGHRRLPAQARDQEQTDREAHRRGSGERHHGDGLPGLVPDPPYGGCLNGVAHRTRPH
jgi:hypothetical protein